MLPTCDALPFPLRRHRVRTIGCALAFIAGAAFAQAPSRPEAARLPEAEILASLVTVGVRSVAHARSARHLGNERQGTGIVFDAAGHVLTSALLVQEADSILLTTADARTVHAAVVLADETSGLAILRAAAGLGVRPLPAGSATTMPIPGAVVVASAARGRAVDVGTVVARGEYAGRREVLIEGALVVIPAVSDYAGAALVDGDGRLVGVGVLKAPIARAADATPTPGNVFLAVEAFQSALAGAYRGETTLPRRPWLGLVLSDAGTPLTIDEVPPDSPAERAGLRVGDVVTALNHEPVATRAALYRRLWRERTGTDLVLTVRREGVARDLRVRAIDRKDYQIHRARLGTPRAGLLDGLLPVRST
jgi:S1-C subfamily serine protease